MTDETTQLPVEEATDTPEVEATEEVTEEVAATEEVAEVPAAE